MKIETVGKSKICLGYGRGENFGGVANSFKYLKNSVFLESDNSYLKKELLAKCILDVLLQL